MRIKRSFDKMFMSEECKDIALDNILKTANSLRHGKNRNARNNLWRSIAAITSVAAAVLVLFFTVVVPKIAPPSNLPVAPNVTGQISNDNNIIDEKTNSAYATMLLRLNPEIEFRVDEDSMIIEVIGTNEDGIELIDGIDFSGFSFENATIIVVNKLIENNYITANSIDKNILLSVSGDGNPADMLEVMSMIIKSVAERYELNVDTVQTDDNQLEIVLAKGEQVPGENDLPIADPENLPTYMEIEYKLTGKINKPEDIGWREVEGDRVFQHGYGEVDNVYLSIKGGKKYNASQIVDFDTAGDWISTATLQTIHSLITKGYITSEMPGQIVVNIKKCPEKQFTNAKELISLMLEEAGLQLEVQEIDQNRLKIVPSNAPVDYEKPTYTLSDMLDTRINKDFDKITNTQMKIMQLGYSPDGAQERLEHRYWAVMPNFFGLSEEEVIYLCELSGLTPKIVHEDFIEGASDPNSIGKVIYPAAETAGFTAQVGIPIQINIQTNNPPPPPRTTYFDIISNGQKVIPYEITRDSKILNYDTRVGFTLSDGDAPLGDQLAQLADSLPIVVYGNDFELDYFSFQVEFHQMSVYDKNYKPIFINTTLDKLKQLKSGTYYVGVVARFYGIHDKAEKEREYSAKEGCFRLVVR